MQLFSLASYLSASIFLIASAVARHHAPINMKKFTGSVFPFIEGLYNVIMSRAFVFLNCDIGSDKAIIAEMNYISGVSRAMSVSGIYDIVANINADSDRGLA